MLVLLSVRDETDGDEGADCTAMMNDRCANNQRSDERSSVGNAEEPVGQMRRMLALTF